MSNEVEFCGKCKRQQSQDDGYTCKICGKPTVTWNMDTESASAAQKKWEWRNPSG